MNKKYWERGNHGELDNRLLCWRRWSKRVKEREWQIENVLYVEKQRMRKNSGCRRSVGTGESTPIEIPTAVSVNGGTCVDI